MNIQQFQNRQAVIAESIEAFRKELMDLAYTRKDVIREYVNLAHRDKRGKCEGLAWEPSSLSVVASWNFYEGHCKMEFPNELIWSDEPLLALRTQQAEKHAAAEAERERREIEQRDELISKYPIDNRPQS